MLCKEYFMHTPPCKNIQTHILKAVLQHEIPILSFVCSIETNWDLVIKIPFISLCSTPGQSFLASTLGLLDVFKLTLSFLQVPATREVLGSLPNVFSALCLNARGLQSFVQCQPFERLFKVLLSPDYLPAMRRRRSSDPLGKSPGFILQ